VELLLFGNTKSDKSSSEPSPTGRKKEEEEALAQAEIWMKIAEQKKTETVDK
jgi:hypothetical protein